MQIAVTNAIGVWYNILNLFAELKEVGYKETLTDEDEVYVSDIWFYGEV